MTSRNLKEKDFAQIAEFIHRGVQLTQKINGGVQGGIRFDILFFRLAVK